MPTIAWDAAANATTYELRLANRSTGKVVDMKGLTGTSYTPASDLTAGNYSVIARAFTDAGQISTWSPRIPSRSSARSPASPL